MQKINYQNIINPLQSYIKLYLENGKVISSNSIDIENIDSYTDYSIFPKDIIAKCQQIKDSDDLKNSLTEKINWQIDNYYETNNQN